MERVLLVTIKWRHENDAWTLDDLAQEMEELIGATDAVIVEHIACNVDGPTPNYFVGKGKAEEISMVAADAQADAVIFSRDLSGTQQRNLEDVIGRKTIDRTQLILDIFARHAKSPDGKMQVELAQLQYLMPRLLGKGLILSRQGGGIGTSGPGETKLEIDRRRIRARIEKLQEDLRHVKMHRATARKKRKENAVPSVALVGYTNAGKSTLLNALTEAGTTVHDGMFTTLDPLSKSLRLPNGENIVISDTVGFLHKLPHNLIEAFKATLEEVVEADLLLHVLDISHPRALEHYRSVIAVLEELGVHEKPAVSVLNKIDLVEDQALLRTYEKEYPDAILVSAISKMNLSGLLEKIQDNFKDTVVTLKLKIPHTRMDLVSQFYKLGKVIDIQYQQKAIKVHINLPRVTSEKLLREKDIEQL
ncbi:MAG TPA: GTPase HflX [Candidatus Omnitrophota bacterium]|nr:GTPase HflX [Candidatus Omnitrophota bacterium]HQJ15481.1 GTPase HflX [Candidatus Omnitrophota bacterium]